MIQMMPLRANPYVGPRAFRNGEALYGRDREVLDLLDLLIAERLVLLYSPSGAGKTSLVQAALIPRLEKEDFTVLPPMRVSLVPLEVVPDTVNRYTLSLLLSLEEALAPDEQMPPAELAKLSFSDYLKWRTEILKCENAVLVFDQFEEILTLNPADRKAKGDFFTQIGAALRHLRCWALFIMREEFVAGLAPYLNALPTRLSTTYRLELLTMRAAQEAIQRPARAAGVEFTDVAAERLSANLATVHVQHLDGHMEVVTGNYIEPVQLQVVCHRLWDGLAPEATEIGLNDLEMVGDVDTALRSYYAEQVATTSRETGVGERTIRDWFDQQLITEQGIRGQVLQGPAQSQGLDNCAIWPLVDAHLVRAEVRRGATWFELAHDRLIGPVRSDNATWCQTHLSALQRQAALWEEKNRPATLLLRDEALAEAEQWITMHQQELTPPDLAFVDACRAAVQHTALEAEARSAQRLRRFRRLAVGEAVAFGLVFVSLVLTSFASSDLANAAVILCLTIPSALVGFALVFWTLILTTTVSVTERRERLRPGRKRGDRRESKS